MKNATGAERKFVKGAETRTLIYAARADGWHDVVERNPAASVYAHPTAVRCRTVEAAREVWKAHQAKLLVAGFVEA